MPKAGISVPILTLSGNLFACTKGLQAMPSTIKDNPYHERLLHDGKALLTAAVENAATTRRRIDQTQQLLRLSLSLIQSSNQVTL